jgi:hypothetical protein
MRRVLLLSAALSLVGAGLAPLPAAAATPPRVEGYSCPAMLGSLAPSKVWRTSFRGNKRDLNTGIFWPYSATACFTSQKDCKAWLYWAQSDWPDQNTFVPCRRVG